MYSVVEELYLENLASRVYATLQYKIAMLDCCLTFTERFRFLRMMGPMTNEIVYQMKSVRNLTRDLMSD